MLSAAATGTNPSPQNTTVPGQVLTINATTTNTSAANVHMIFFSPTYRFLVPNTYAYLAARTSTRPYIRGIAENYALVPNDSTLWYHRRIVVACKEVVGNTPAVSQVTGAQAIAGATSYRQMHDITGDSSSAFSATWDFIQDQLFQGVKTTDWSDQMTAKVDNARFTVIADARYALSSANAASRPRFKKFWTPINKTIQYDDEENGTSITPSPFSIDSKPGVGNIFVLDLFEAPAPISTTTSTLSISSTQTLYWHEK